MKRLLSRLSHTAFRIITISGICFIAMIGLATIGAATHKIHRMSQGTSKVATSSSSSGKEFKCKECGEEANIRADGNWYCKLHTPNHSYGDNPHCMKCNEYGTYKIDGFWYCNEHASECLGVDVKPLEHIVKETTKEKSKSEFATENNQYKSQKVSDEKGTYYLCEICHKTAFYEMDGYWFCQNHSLSDLPKSESADNIKNYDSKKSILSMDDDQLKEYIKDSDPYTITSLAFIMTYQDIDKDIVVDVIDHIPYVHFVYNIPSPNQQDIDMYRGSKHYKWVEVTNNLKEGAAKSNEIFKEHGYDYVVCTASLIDYKGEAYYLTDGYRVLVDVIDFNYAD